VPIWTATWGMYGSSAWVMLPVRLTRVAPIKRPQKKRTARWWFLWVSRSVWSSFPPPVCEVVRHCLATHLDDDLRVHIECLACPCRRVCAGGGLRAI
jgi:hypothetical protein